MAETLILAFSEQQLSNTLLRAAVDRGDVPKGFVGEVVFQFVDRSGAVLVTLLAMLTEKSWRTAVATAGDVVPGA